MAKEWSHAVETGHEVQETLVPHGWVCLECRIFKTQQQINDELKESQEESARKQSARFPAMRRRGS